MASKGKSKQDEILFKEQLVDEIRKDFAERQKNRRPYELAWQLNMNFLMGNQYCSVSGRGEIEQEEKYFFWQEKQVFNHIAPIVETRLSRLSKVRPRPVVRPFGNSDSDVNSAKMSTKILDSVYDQIAMSEVVQQATKWSEVCGTSFYKVSWESKKRKFGKNEVNVSDVSVTACPPFEIYPDSNVCQGISDCQSIIHARVYGVDDVKRIWGVDVPGEKVCSFALGSTVGIGGLGYNSTVPSITHETKNNQCVVIERYTRPTVEFPSGRLEIVAGNVLVYVGDLPYFVGKNGERDLPFVRQTSYDTAGCFWGASVVERLIPIQRAYNALKNRKHEFMNRLSMGILAVEDGSVDTDDLEEEGLSPGKILVYRQGSNRPSIMDSGSVPVDFSNEEDRLLNEFVVISGVSEFARNSQTPVNLTSGVALQLLTEQDDLRMASSTDSIKECIKTVSKMILRLYKQFVTGKRLVRLADEQGKTEVFYFQNSDINGDDIVFETETETAQSLATRKSLVMDLLSAGILCDDEGKLSQSTKSKILSMMGLGNWERAQDITVLHQQRADGENIDIDNAEILPVDDHALHVEQHVRFIISGQADKMGKDVKAKILAHIALHKAFIKEEKGEQGQV